MEHQQIVQAERNEERRRYYELLWEIGAGQTDAASLTAEDIDWPNRARIYQAAQDRGNRLSGHRAPARGAAPAHAAGWPRLAGFSKESV